MTCAFPRYLQHSNLMHRLYGMSGIRVSSGRGSAVVRTEFCFQVSGHDRSLRREYVFNQYFKKAEREACTG